LVFNSFFLAQAAFFAQTVKAKEKMPIKSSKKIFLLCFLVGCCAGGVF